jgi:hypothetical protein
MRAEEWTAAIHLCTCQRPSSDMLGRFAYAHHGRDQVPGILSCRASLGQSSLACRCHFVEVEPLHSHSCCLSCPPLRLGTLQTTKTALAQPSVRYRQTLSSQLRDSLCFTHDVFVKHEQYQAVQTLQSLLVLLVDFYFIIDIDQEFVDLKVLLVIIEHSGVSVILRSDEIRLGIVGVDASSKCSLCKSTEEIAWFASRKVRDALML